MKAILIEWRGMKSENIRVIAQTEEYLIVDKPHGLPTVPLKREPGALSLLSFVAHDYPEVGGTTHEGYTLHRLDTATRGLVMFARIPESFSYYQNLQSRGEIIKSYRAYCSPQRCFEGYPPCSFTLVPSVQQKIISRFRPWGKGRKEVRPVTELSNSASQGKASEREYISEVLMHPVTADGLARFDVTIVNGFRHQIRSHLAWGGYPIIGDELYGGKENETLRLYAVSLRFYDRQKMEMVEYSLDEKELRKEYL